ncbi:MAG: PAS domain S-box protein [Dehalococcoidia bacterium]
MVDLLIDLNVLKTIVEETSDAVYLKDVEGRYVMLNESAARARGLDPGEIVGRRTEDLFPDGVARELRAHDLRVLEEGRTLTFEEQIPGHDGSTITLLATKGVVRNSAGEPIGTFGISRDISELQRRQDDLRLTAESFRALFEWHPFPMWVRDIETGAFLEVNVAAAQHYGYSREEFLQLRITDIDVSQHVPEFLHAPSATAPPHETHHHRLKDGRTIEVQLTGHRLSFAGRDATLVVVQDVSERTQTERMRTQLADVVESTHAAIITTSPEGEILSWNIGAERLFGWSEDEACAGKMDLVLPDDAALPDGPLARAARGERLQNLPLRRVRKDGQPVDLIVDVSPIADPAGRVVALSMIAHDITEQVRSQEAMRESAELSRVVLASLKAHIAVLDQAGNIIAVNESWRSIGGQRDGNHALAGAGVGVNYLGMCMLARGDGEQDARRAGVGIRSVLTGEAPEFVFEYSCGPEDAPCWYLFHVAPLTGPHGGAVVSHIDVSPSRRAELELRASERRFRAILDLAPDGIVVVDPNGQITIASAHTASLFGYTPEELVGKNVDLLLPRHLRGRHALHPPDYTSAPIRRDGGSGFELLGLRQDGTEFPIEVSLGPVDTGHGPLVTAIIRDITERKHAEEMEIRLRAAEQAEQAKTNLISSVSHELRTPLAVIRGYVTTLIEYGQHLSSAEVREHLSNADAAARRLEHLVGDLLTLGRLDAGVLKMALTPESVQSLLAEAAETAGRLFPARPIHLSVGSITAELDRTRMLQVLDNLLENGDKYAPPGTPIDISARGNRHEISISVRTDGSISDADLERIFERFVQVHPDEDKSRRGAGLGLALSRRIVQAHGGRMWATRPDAGGLQINITLPREQPAPD